MASDIHSAIHILGFQPLLCDTESNGEDTVNVSDFVPNLKQLALKELDVCLKADTVWKLSTTNYRRRKVAVSVARQDSAIPKRLLNEINSVNLLAPGTRTESRIVLYFVGIHFSDTVSSNSIVHWKFIRGGVHMVSHCLSRGWTGEVFTPWVDGLRRVADGRVDLAESESPEQEEMIRAVCSNLVKQLAS